MRRRKLVDSYFCLTNATKRRRRTIAVLWYFFVIRYYPIVLVGATDGWRMCLMYECAYVVGRWNWVRWISENFFTSGSSELHRKRRCSISGRFTFDVWTGRSILIIAIEINVKIRVYCILTYQKKVALFIKFVLHTVLSHVKKLPQWMSDEFQFRILTFFVCRCFPSWFPRCRAWLRQRRMLSNCERHLALIKWRFACGDDDYGKLFFRYETSTFVVV